MDHPFLASRDSATPIAAAAALGRAEADTSQFLTFRLRDETFGLPVLAVREIIAYARPTAVPMMPDVVQGVIDLRGSVVPVVDLALRLGRGATPIRARTCIVVVEARGNDGMQIAGVVVDAVDAVREFEAGRIEPAPSFGSGPHARFILGMARADDSGFVTLLDVAHLLPGDDLAALARAGDALPGRGGGSD